MARHLKNKYIKLYLWKVSIRALSTEHRQLGLFKCSAALVTKGENVFVLLVWTLSWVKAEIILSSLFCFTWGLQHTGRVS